MSQLTPLARHAHWALRLALLSVFLYHGLDKFGNLGGFAEMTGLPVAVALLVALAEAGGGLLVFLGGFLKDWMTRLGALAIIPVMLGAIFMVHWGQWSTTPRKCVGVCRHALPTSTSDAPWKPTPQPGGIPPPCRSHAVDRSHPRFRLHS